MMAMQRSYVQGCPFHFVVYHGSWEILCVAALQQTNERFLIAMRHCQEQFFGCGRFLVFGRFLLRRSALAHALLLPHCTTVTREPESHTLQPITCMSLSHESPRERGNNNRTRSLGVPRPQLRAELQG